VPRLWTSLSNEQTQIICKMSTERIQGKLMRAGVDKKVVYGLGIPKVMEELAKTMLDENVTAAEGGVKQLTELEVRLMELEERKKEREERTRESELEQIRLGQEQARLDHERRVYEQNMAFQHELFESQRKQHAAENAAREQRQNMLNRREETLVARTKRYGQAVQYALTAMPTEVGDLPSWFNMVENVWSKLEVLVDLRSKLTSHAKSLITRLSLDDQDDYEKLRDFLLKQYQLGSLEYRARFLHANKNPGESWISYNSRLKNLFTYYTNSRDVSTFDNHFDMCVYDKLSDTLPIPTLKHCLGVVKKQHMTASQLADCGRL